MRELEATLEGVFMRQERLTRDEIHRRAVAADAPVDVVSALDGLPEGEYAQDEVVEALGRSSGEEDLGVPADQLDDEDLFRQLGDIHRTRHDTLRHGSDQALANHDERMEELEQEYLRRFPQREVDPERLRSGARQRGDGSDHTGDGGTERAPDPRAAGNQPRTGAEQPWEPRDFAIASGKDPTPENIEWAARVLREQGPSAIERTVP